MKQSKEILAGIVQTVQAHQIYLQCALKIPISASLQCALRYQLREFDRIEAEARSIAYSRGWSFDELTSDLISVKKIFAKIQYAFAGANYKAIKIIIMQNTKGMTRCLHDLRRFHRSDERISTLSQKLMDCEKDNIRQMQGFL